jgi:phosphate transport system substrate-binding protein
MTEGSVHTLWVRMRRRTDPFFDLRTTSIAGNTGGPPMRLASVVFVGLCSSAPGCFDDPREFGEVFESASGGADDDDSETGSDTSSMAGLVVEGSDAVGPILSTLVPDYSDESGVEVELKVTDSSFTVDSVGQGRSDIGLISRDLTQGERDRYPDLVPSEYAFDGIAVVVNVDNGITSLSLSQLADIYSGRATDWMHVGGEPGDLIVYSRPPDSEIGRVFGDIVLGSTPLREDAEQLDSSGQMETAVSEDVSAIAYIGAGVVGGSVKTVTIEGVMPDEGTIQSGGYPITRVFYMLTADSAPNAADSFIEFVRGPEGDAAVVANGYLPAL